MTIIYGSRWTHINSNQKKGESLPNSSKQKRRNKKNNTAQIKKQTLGTKKISSDNWVYFRGVGWFNTPIPKRPTNWIFIEGIGWTSSTISKKISPKNNKPILAKSNSKIISSIPYSNIFENNKTITSKKIRFGFDNIYQSNIPSISFSNGSTINRSFGKDDSNFSILFQVPYLRFSLLSYPPDSRINKL